MLLYYYYIVIRTVHYYYNFGVICRYYLMHLSCANLYKKSNWY